MDSLSPDLEVRMPDFEIVRREDFSDTTYLLEVRHPLLARAARPGQFVIVMLHEHGERIPLTIADYDREGGTVTLVIQAVGKTTREMQAACRVGTRLHALVGPMGVPTAIGHAKKVVCVGGGLGVAPIFAQARGHKEAGATSSRCSAFAPARSSSGKRSSPAPATS
jgi:NAD(P)H-flavin reductase